MPKEKLKTIYVCTQCGETSPRWLGRCPSCGAWNTMTEDVVAAPGSTRNETPARQPLHRALRDRQALCRKS